MRRKDFIIAGLPGDIFILVAFFALCVISAHMRYAANVAPTYTATSGQTSHIIEGVYDTNELTGQYAVKWVG